MDPHRAVVYAPTERVPTIDLGDLSVPEPEQGPPQVSRETRRGLLIAMVVLAVTFGGAPSEPGTPYLGDPTWTGTASLAGYALGAESIILYEPGGTAIIGRDIATGDARWKMKVASEPQSISDLGNGVAAVVVGDRSTDEAEPRDTTVTMLITYGGTILARIPGSTVVPIAIGPYLFVATGQHSVTADCPGDRDSCTDGSTFDTAAERQLWRLPLTGDLIASVADPGTGIREVATMRRDGIVEIHDPATGGIVRSYALPGGRQNGHGDGGFWPPALLVGDTLIMAVRRDRRAELTAFPVGPGGHEWTASLPVSPALTATTAQFYIAGCGRMLCLRADGADAVFAPETGALRARLEVQVVGQIGDLLLAIPSSERPGTSRSRRTVLLISAADGRRIGTLPDTAIVPWRDGLSRVMLAHKSPGATDFTVLDAAGGSRVLGAVSGSDLTCSATSGLLICADAVGLVRAWRMP